VLVSIANSLYFEIKIKNLGEGTSIPPTLKWSLSPKLKITKNETMEGFRTTKQKDKFLSRGFLLRGMKKGYKMTEEQKQRLSEAHKGQISPNKGQKASAKTKLKLSLSHKQLWKNPDYRKRMIQINIVDMQELAKAKGGKCLSNEYINPKTKLKWQCEKGHEWMANPTSIKTGTWCPYCKGRYQTIRDMQQRAKAKGGKCLSEKYINAREKLKWQCEKGHIWEATPYNIKSGKWCPYCRGRYGTIEEMQELAKTKGGKCLSEKFISVNKRLRWQCKEGHIWEAIPSSIKRGSWCSYCSKPNQIKKTIEDMQELAKAKGGKCLSEKYFGNKTKLKWQCKEGHIWETMPGNIQSGKWCPICSEGVSERICRKYFEEIFNKKFPKTRPKWLKNKTGKLLELDGYCPELRIAFEYQGQQHYLPTTFFTKGRGFENQQEADKLKKDLCNKNNVILIEVPYTVEFEDMGEFIIKKCKEHNIDVPKITKVLNYKLFDIYSPQRLKEMQELAKAREGKCLSERYIDAKTKMKWQCKEGHVWMSHSNNIKTGNWCPFCNRRNITLEDMQEIAKTKGGKCLSTGEINTNSILKWQCKEGHIWNATSSNVLDHGSWCPYCAGTYKKTLEDIQRLAKAKEGKCLSEKYINSNTKMKWQCKEGHIWETIPQAINQGQWCPYCAHRAKLTIEDMRELAKTKGGKCLSEFYIPNHSKLKWQCKKGHIWEAAPSHMKENHWCPYCAGVHKKTMEDMHKLAEVRGGKCLSKEYINSKTKLIWQCKNRHEWEANPHNIQSGKWCPVCARKRTEPKLRLI